MIQIEMIERDIRESVGRFLFDLQGSKLVNEDEYKRIDKLSRDLAIALKEEGLVPKSVLNDLNIFVRTVRAEAPYMEGNSTNLKKKADFIEMTLDLVLRGESHSDRQAGIPRII
ncbi:hypothetical protein QSH39_006160 [Xanthomonas arboricola pv. corylina]|uniref:hypothetical protein n=1 Tax=Xanthomonas arboricola TaxID=56448 RepID=UPI000CEE8D99|nr:hypothetical protein [Xanthomonas arboricola]MDN0201657.1 hypothetical protein [Xanthomonas arboricola pv. corylina]MDN0206132.1 hypothetical protein [Xanthomonas arboricola pv. corylina]MDN0210382.1 hypothetical protein [Xanthomonas arboricola pv. corylina]MDN0214874.1 hypothetical protein [Xanthomonas arboricola pv. corylina]PPU05284.1 hypothetical protein XacyCFBP2565_21875 [Xanthomonas arboricola pv. corylina]